MQWGIQRKASAAWARVFFPCEQKTGGPTTEESKHIARKPHVRRCQMGADFCAFTDGCGFALAKAALKTVINRISAFDF